MATKEHTVKTTARQLFTFVGCLISHISTAFTGDFPLLVPIFLFLFSSSNERKTDDIGITINLKTTIKYLFCDMRFDKDGDDGRAVS